MTFSRRGFLKAAGAGAVAVTMVSPLDAFYRRSAAGDIASGFRYGPLSPKLAENAGDHLAFELLHFSQP